MAASGRVFLEHVDVKKMEGQLSKRVPSQFASRSQLVVDFKATGSEPFLSLFVLDRVCFYFVVTGQPTPVFGQHTTYDATHPARLLLSSGAGRYRPSYSSRFVRVKS